LEQKTLFEKLFVAVFIAGIFVLGLGFVKKTPESKSKNLEISYLDVGQGDAALIKTPNEKYILIDGGPDKKVLSEMGKKMPPTKKEIDAIVLSHPHADHVAGLNYVLDRYTVKKIYMTGVSHTSPDYVDFLKKIKEKGTPAEKFFAGKEFSIDEVSIRAYWPSEDMAQSIVKDLNDTSIVFSAQYKENTFLFLGDLSAKKQEEMMTKTQLPKSQVLKVAHHGSKTGASQTLLEIIQPKYAVISSGASNDFGHPAPTTLSLLSTQIILRTDQKGTITFSYDGKTLILF